MTTSRNTTYPIPISFSESFCQAMTSLHQKYPDQLFSILGVASSNTDIVRFTEDFFNKSASASLSHSHSPLSPSPSTSTHPHSSSPSMPHQDNVANVADTSIDSNANVSSLNINHYTTEAVKSIHKLNSIFYLYSKIEELYGTDSAITYLDKLISGEIFCNDLHSTHQPYCYAFDLRPLLTEGMTFFEGNMKILPPKRTSSFISLMEQAVAYISNQIMGACSFPDFFPVFDWFLRQEFGSDYTQHLSLSESYTPDTISYQIANYCQRLIYSLNFPFRGGAQSAFTNLSVLDRGFLKALFCQAGQEYTFPDYTTVDIESTLSVSKYFFELYSDMNGKEGYFTFPVMTLALSVEEDPTPSSSSSSITISPDTTTPSSIPNTTSHIPDTPHYLSKEELTAIQGSGKHLMDEETFIWASEVNRHKSLGNIFLSKTTSFSSCCRLKNDFSKLSSHGYQNSFGVGGLSIGSHRVMGLNLPRIALLSKDNPDVLKEDLELIHKGLFAHRMMIKRNISRGLLPLYTHGWINLDKQYSTVGFVGLYEYLVNLGLDPKSESGIEAGLSLLRTIEESTLSWQSKSDELQEHCVYNIEQIPAESMATRLAKCDTILGYNPHNLPIYSNQYLPLWEGESIYDRFRIQGRYDQLTSGGSILHITQNSEGTLSARQYRVLMIQALVSGCQYFAINRTFCKCNDCGAMFMESSECPKCHSQNLESYTRVVGYLSKVSAWAKNRRLNDFPRRYRYSTEEISESLKG